MGILDPLFRPQSPTVPPSQTTVNVEAQPVNSTQSPQPMQQQQQQPDVSGALVTPPPASSAINAQGLKTNYIDHAVSQTKAAGRWLWRGCVWGFFLVGVPAAIVAVANLPVPVWRQSVSQYAPFLLIPTYLSFENHFKSAYAATEKARQLIETPTSPADFDLGEQSLIQAKQNLDAIPLTFSQDWDRYGYTYHWWYNSYFSPYGLQQARVKVGNLEARLSQERTAQKLLQEAENTIRQAKGQYQQLATLPEKQAAQQTWRNAIAQMTQIPPQTLAGRTAAQKQAIANQEFAQVVGVQASRNTADMFTAGAEEFAKRASATVKNPPHAVARWGEAEQLWLEAIKQLETIDAKTLKDTPQTYVEVQKLLATYKANLAEVRRRLQEEKTAAEKFNQVQQDLNQLRVDLPADAPARIDRSQAVARLLVMRNQLEQIPAGTTVTAKSAQIKANVEQRLKQLKAL